MKKKINLSRLFSSTVFLIAISIVASMAYWLYSQSIEGTVATRTYKDIPVVIEMENTSPNSKGLMLLLDEPPTVEVTVQGTQSELALYKENKIKATVNVNSVDSAGEVTLPIDIDLANSKLSVKSQSKEQVDLKFDKKVTISVEVKAMSLGKVQEGFTLDTLKAVPAYINVTGPEEIINKISHMSSTVDVTNASATVIKKDVEFQVIDFDGKDIPKTFLSFDKSKIDSITAPLLVTKSVGFSYSIVNSSGGYDSNFVTVKVTPANLLVLGASEVVNTLNNINLGTFDMAEVTKDGFREEIEIPFENGVNSVDSSITKAVIEVRYSNVVTKEFTLTNISAINGASGKAAALPASIKVTVRGLAADIDALNASDIRALIDLEGDTATGKVTKNVTFTFAGEPKVGIYGVYRAVVTIG